MGQESNQLAGKRHARRALHLMAQEFIERCHEERSKGTSAMARTLDENQI
jgi:hypothetical protein